MGKSLTGKELGKGITQRADGLFVGRVMVNGKTHTVSSRNLTTLRSKLKELRNDTGDIVRDVASVQRWYNAFYDDVKSRRLKNDMQARKMRRTAETTYLPLIGEKPINGLRKKDIQEATNKLIDEGKGYYAISAGLAEMRQTFQYAFENEVISRNPCAGICIDGARKNTKTKPADSLDDWEVDLMLECMSDGPFKYAVRVMLLTGMRVGEISALTWDDIDFEEKTIRVNKGIVLGSCDGKYVRRVETPKTEKGNRTIPFIGNIEDVLMEWKDERECLHKQLIMKGCKAYDEHKHNLVFVTNRGNYCVGSTFNSALKRTVRRMQKIENDAAYYEARKPRVIKDIHTHMFRHTFITKCSDAGMIQSYIMEIVGHTSYSMTQKYTHTTAEQVDKEVRKLDNMFRV